MKAGTDKSGYVYLLSISTVEGQCRKNCGPFVNQEGPGALTGITDLCIVLSLCEEDMGIGSSFAPPRSDQIFTIRYVTPVLVIRSHLYYKVCYSSACDQIKSLL